MAIEPFAPNKFAAVRRLSAFLLAAETEFDWLQFDDVEVMSAQDAPRCWQTDTGHLLRLSPDSRATLMTLRLAAAPAFQMYLVTFLVGDGGAAAAARLMVTREQANDAAGVAASYLMPSEQIVPDCTVVLARASLVPKKACDEEVLFASAFCAAEEADRRAWVRWSGGAREWLTRDVISRIARINRPPNELGGKIDFSLAASSGAPDAPFAAPVLSSLSIAGQTFDVVEAQPGAVRLLGPVPDDVIALSVDDASVPIRKTAPNAFDLEIGSVDFVRAIQKSSRISWKRR